MKLFFFTIASAICIAYQSYSTISKPVVAASQQQRPPMYVLQVGIGKYLNSPKWADLRGSINDVMEMRKVLESDRYKIPTANIVTLTDDKATKQGIFAAYQSTLIANAKKYFETAKKRDAVVMFQFSGHGSQVPDVDGDEKDGLDETLVTYDSQDVKGKNFDITDDEIFALTSELKKYTDNIVYVFDSCHSGSGTRTAEDARRLPPRTTVPEPIPLPFPATRSGQADDGSDGSVMPASDDYIVISAAQANQIATQKYCFEECGSDKEPVVFGLLSYYLIDGLKNARSDTSYRELMDSVSKKVEAERPSQVPLVEGDERRTVFGSLGSSEDAFVPVLKADGATVNIRAGAILGVSNGSIVSFYDRPVTKFDSAEKIATGIVIASTPTEATVKISNSRRAITTFDKAVVASPDLGSSRTKVIIDSQVEASLSRAIRDEFAPRNNVADSRGVDVLSEVQISRQTGRWGVAVLRDKYSKVFPHAGEMQNAPDCGVGNDPNADVYYIAGPDYVPLFGYCVGATPERSAQNAQSITQALTHIARYRSIQRIQNARSRLAGRVVVRPIRLSMNSGPVDPFKNCVDGKLTADRYDPVVRAVYGRYPIGTTEIFWFEVTNNSPYDIYVALLNLQSNGSVKLKFPRNIDDEKNGVLIPKNGGKRIVNGDQCRVEADGNISTGAFRTSRRPEIDAFKLLLTTRPMTWEDLSYLEMDSLRRNENASLATINEWIAVDIVFEVGDQVKK
jgi:hypothetical protein